MLSEKRNNVEYIEGEIGNSRIDITNMIENFEKLEALYYETSTEKEYFEEKLVIECGLIGMKIFESAKEDTSLILSSYKT